MNPLIFMGINILAFLGMAYLISGKNLQGFFLKIFFLGMALWHGYYGLNEAVRQANANLKTTVKAENSQKGFTLIELIIVLGMLFIFLVVVTLIILVIRWLLKH